MTGPRAATRGTRRRSWEAWSVGIALGGLLIGLAFNTVGVWRQLEQDQQAAEQAVQTRVFTQLGLLTQLNATVTASERSAANANEHRCDKPPLTNTLDAKNKAALFQALSNYEYLAWLFNHKYLTVEYARAFWTPYMLVTYELGRTFDAEARIRKSFPELTYFRRSTPPEQRQVHLCPVPQRR